MIASELIHESPIEAMEALFRRYVVVGEKAYLPFALWCAGTHLVQEFDCFPYIALQSPVKRCGKTRVMEVMEMLCASPERLVVPTPAVLFRMMAKSPTLLLDEVEFLRSAGNSSDSQQAILSILNAGHRKGAYVRRCVAPDYKPTRFPTYGPKVFAAIGGLPDTLSDRSIIVQMNRKRANQKTERFLFSRVLRETEPLRSSVKEWARLNRVRIKAAYDDMRDLEFLNNDRDAEIWMPLFAVCSIAAPDRLDELRKCAVASSAVKREDDEADSLRLRLLADTRSIWTTDPSEKPETSISTREILSRLTAIIEDSEWSERGLSPIQLAALLRPFSIYPRGIRVGKSTKKGYLLSEMRDAWERYLGPDPSQVETLETSSVNPGVEGIFKGETPA